MKRIFSAAMSFMLLLTLAACGNGSAENTGKISGAADSTVSESDGKAKPADTEDSGSGQSKKTLVVYYSATGNTKEAAEYIASATGGDLFEIVPSEPYSTADLDWTNEDSRIVDEHNNPGKRKVSLVTAVPPNFKEYDTVYIGYPIWWGIAAWPVGSFIEENDFTGKKVVPFCTSSSSGLGESGKLLEKAAGTGNWIDGMRFSSNISKAEIEEWINNMNE